MDTDESTADRHTRAVHLLSQMEGFEGSELAKSGVDAWDYYLQRPRGDEVEGRSPVVTGDVSAMVESALSQVSEALATDNLVEFDGKSDDDEKQAQLEGAVVSAAVMSGPGWFRLASCIKNALLLRRGVVRVEVVTKEETNVIALEGVGRIAKAYMEIMQGEKFASYDAETKRGTVERTESRQCLDVVNVDAENFLYVQWPLDDFENIPACAERRVTTRQQLMDEEKISGEKVDAITSTAQPAKSDQAAHSLKGYVANIAGISGRQRMLEWFAVYYLHDGKRYRAIVADCKVLDEEVVSKRPPFAIGVPFINPGHLEGFSFYDKLKSTQDINTALTRMLNDNANAATMNRIAVIEGACNNDQLTDQDPSGVLQFRKSSVGGDIRNGIMPIQVPDLTAGLVTALTYQKGTRSEMAGASLDVGTGKVQLPDRMGSMGLDRAYSASEQLSSLILKTFSQSLIKGVWMLAHDLLRTQWTGELPTKYEGRWINPKPSQWPRRYDATVKPGMSPGERQRRSQALGAFIDLQMKLAGMGMEDILVDAERYYRALCDWARLNDIKRPEQYFINPASPGAQKAFKAKADAAAQQQQAAAQLQKTALALEQMGHAVKKYGIDVNAAVEKYKADSSSDAKEAELTIGLVKDRETAERDLKAPKPIEGKAEGNGSAAGE